MMKKTLQVCCFTAAYFVFFCMFGLFDGMVAAAEDPAQAQLAKEAIAPSSPPAETVKNEALEHARNLAGADKLLEARDAYRTFLKQEGIDESLKKTAQSELEAVNMNILFSPLETEDSLIYTVVEGDNLYNIAKKYKTTVPLIKKASQLSSDVIRPGKKLKISKAKFSLVVDKSDNTLQLMAGDNLLKTYRVATGENNSTPTGPFTISVKLENPTWYKTGAVVPPDSPDNILGTRWLGFSSGTYGIHGTTEPESIGKQASAGCIRMRNEDVEELYSIVPIGTVVTIND